MLWYLLGMQGVTKIMHIWYKAVCKKCGEGRDIYVDTPSRTETYLKEDNEAIYNFLWEHSNCELILMHSDLEYDKLWAEGWDFERLPNGGGKNTKVIKRYPK